VLVGSCQNSSASSEGSGTGTDSVQLKNTGINFQTKNACKISADYLANLMGTINYEVLTMLKDRIPRVYIY
jgi:alanine racemase